MSDSGVPPSSDSGLPGIQGSSPRFPDGDHRSDHFPESDSNDVFQALHQALTEGTQSADGILRAITEAAWALTGASSVALALRTEDAVVCRARSGESAPEIGTQLNTESGISGECFRTYQSLRCDDALADPLADAEVCRALGIRSIAVVPIGSDTGTLGILEVFSSLPRAFTDAHVGILERLAEVAELVDRKVCDELTVVAAPAVVAAIRQELITRPIVTGPALDSDREDDSSQAGRTRYWILGVAAVLLVLTTGVAWFSWRGTDAEPATATRATSQSDKVGVASNAAPAVFPAKPNAGGALRTNGPSAKQSVRNAGEVERILPSSKRPLKISGGSIPTEAAVRDAKTSVDPPPVLVEEADKIVVGNLVSGTTSMPELEAPLSKGVTVATLVHKVDPVYPATALAQHLEGLVVLQATITEEGTLRDVSVISGSPVLVQASTEALREWRYTPSLLDGKPTAVRQQITFIFKAP